MVKATSAQYPALGLDATQKFPRLHQSEYTRDRRNAAECHHYSPAQGDRADGDDGAPLVIGPGATASSAKLEPDDDGVVNEIHAVSKLALRLPKTA